MASNMQKIIPCLWFDENAEEAVDFYIVPMMDRERKATKYLLLGSLCR